MGAIGTSAVRGVRQGDAVTLIFAGAPRYYVGRVTIEGVKNDRLSSLLEFATKLSPGTAFSEPQIPAGTEGVTEMLQQQGYYEPTVTAASQIDVAGDQVNVTYTVAIGPQARVGKITLAGTDTGLTLEEFRKKAKLKEGNRVTRDTASNAMDQAAEAVPEERPSGGDGDAAASRRITRRRSRWTMSSMRTRGRR